MARANVIIHECRRTPASNTSRAASESGYVPESEKRPACACATRRSMLATWPASAAMNSAVEPYRSRVLGRSMRTAAWLNPLRLPSDGDEVRVRPQMPEMREKERGGLLT